MSRPRRTADHEEFLRNAIRFRVEELYPTNKQHKYLPIREENGKNSVPRYRVSYSHTPIDNHEALGIFEGLHKNYDLDKNESEYAIIYRDEETKKIKKWYLGKPDFVVLSPIIETASARGGFKNRTNKRKKNSKRNKTNKRKQ